MLEVMKLQNSLVLRRSRCWQTVSRPGCDDAKSPLSLTMAL